MHATALSALATVAASEEDATRRLELLEQSGAKFREYLEPDKNNGAYRIRLPNIWGVSGLAAVMSDLGDANANDLHRRLARISADPLSWVPWLHAALAEAYLGNPEAAIDKLEAARQRGFNKLWILDEYERNPHLDTVKHNIGWLEVRERIRVFNEQTLARLRADVPEAFPPPA